MVAHMVADMVADMVANLVADMEVDMVADMEVDNKLLSIYLVNCLKAQIFFGCSSNLSPIHIWVSTAELRNLR